MAALWTCTFAGMHRRHRPRRRRFAMHMGLSPLPMMLHLAVVVVAAAAMSISACVAHGDVSSPLTEAVPPPSPPGSTSGASLSSSSSSTLSGLSYRRLLLPTRIPSLWVLLSPHNDDHVRRRLLALTPAKGGEGRGGGAGLGGGLPPLGFGALAIALLVSMVVMLAVLAMVGASRSFSRWE